MPVLCGKHYTRLQGFKKITHIYYIYNIHLYIKDHVIIYNKIYIIKIIYIYIYSIHTQGAQSIIGETETSNYIIQHGKKAIQKMLGVGSYVVAEIRRV